MAATNMNRAGKHTVLAALDTVTKRLALEFVTGSEFGPGARLQQRAVIDFSNQKVVTNAAREILLISRSPIPYPKGTLDFEYEKVTGIQLYSKQALKFYHDTPKSILEKAEENDMMRFIENGHKVHAIVSPYKTVSVDTPKDLALVNEILKEKQHG